MIEKSFRRVGFKIKGAISQVNNKDLNLKIDCIKESVSKRGNNAIIEMKNKINPTRPTGVY